MLDYLLSCQPPGKGEDPADSSLFSIIANIALVAGVVILKPAIEQHFRLTIDHYTSITLNNRQSLKAVIDARRDLLSPALDGLSTLHNKVKPAQATVATAVTVVKLAPTPVQVFQEQSTMGPMWGIFACMMFALVGIVLAFQHHRQPSSFGWSSPSATSSSGSSLQPFSRDSTPTADDFSDEPSDSDGHPPPLPIFDIFYDPILRLDKAIDTGDEKEVRDMDGAPPPPPPSFPTPVEDGDAFKSKSAIFRWLSLTLVVSIISFVINRFVKSRSKIHQVSPPTASECITVNDISANVITLFPSANKKPVIKPACLNLLPPVEIETESPVNTPTLVMSPVSQRFRNFMTAIFSVLVMACLHRLPFIAEYLLDHYLKKAMNFFFPTPIRGHSLKALDVVVENVCDPFFFCLNMY